MKYYEILKLNKSVLQCINLHGGNLRDYKYIAMYEEYLEMISDGNKVSYIVYILSQKYGVSERTIYKLVSRFSVDITVQRVHYNV